MLYSEPIQSAPEPPSTLQPPQEPAHSLLVRLAPRPRQCRYSICVGSEYSHGHSPHTQAALARARKQTILCLQCMSLVDMLNARTAANRTASGLLQPDSGCSSCSRSNSQYRWWHTQHKMAQAILDSSRTH